MQVSDRRLQVRTSGNQKRRAGAWLAEGDHEGRPYALSRDVVGAPLVGALWSSRPTARARSVIPSVPGASHPSGSGLQSKESLRWRCESMVR